MMKKLSSLLLLGLSWSLPGGLYGGRGRYDGECNGVASSPQPDQSSVDQAVAYVLTHYHYSREPLDPTLSAKIFDEYLKELDPRTRVFPEGGHRFLLRLSQALGANIKKGDLAPAFAIYSCSASASTNAWSMRTACWTKQPDLK